MEFGFVCKLGSLYAEKYGEECINIIESLESADDRWQVF